MTLGARQSVVCASKTKHDTPFCYVNPMQTRHPATQRHRGDGGPEDKLMSTQRGSNIIVIFRRSLGSRMEQQAAAKEIVLFISIIIIIS